MLAPDDAKTDVILAAATAVLGLTLRGFVASLPFYPRPGLIAAVLDLLWIFALSTLVPVLLARYRGDGITAFGVGQGGPARGLLLAVPVAILGVSVQALAGVRGPGLLLGRVWTPGTAFAGGADLAIGAGRVALLSLGALVLTGFLAMRSREGFPRSPDRSVTELTRTVGLAVVAVAALGGLLRAIGPGTFAASGLNLLALVAVLLLADRAVPSDIAVPRATIVAPVIVVVVAHVFAAGGLFRGDLLTGLYTAALAAGATVAISALTQARAGVGVAIPLVIAVHWWPTCLSPLTLAGGLC